MYKKYVDVLVHISRNGTTTPMKMKAGYYGEWVKIDKVKDCRQRASLLVGGVGWRYTCEINYLDERRTIYLYDESGKWFLESTEAEIASMNLLSHSLPLYVFIMFSNISNLSSEIPFFFFFIMLKKVLIIHTSRLLNQINPFDFRRRAFFPYREA
jgi:hypothetical protein